MYEHNYAGAQAARRSYEHHVQATSRAPLQAPLPCRAENCPTGYRTHEALLERDLPTFSFHQQHATPCAYTRQFHQQTSAFYQLAHVRTAHPAKHPDGIVIDELNLEAVAGDKILARSHAIVVMTAARVRATSGRVRALREQLAAPFAPKSFTPQQLLDAVEEAERHSQVSGRCLPTMPLLPVMQKAEKARIFLRILSFPRHHGDIADAVPGGEQGGFVDSAGIDEALPHPTHILVGGLVGVQSTLKLVDTLLRPKGICHGHRTHLCPAIASTLFPTQ